MSYYNSPYYNSRDIRFDDDYWNPSPARVYSSPVSSANFHITSTNIRIKVSDGSTFLHADAKAANGHLEANNLNLDDCVGNNDGNFIWGGKDFTKSARNITFSLEGEQNWPVLRASLKDAHGVWHDRYINLAERIENTDGFLVYRGRDGDY